MLSVHRRGEGSEFIDHKCGVGFKFTAFFSAYNENKLVKKSPVTGYFFIWIHRDQI